MPGRKGQNPRGDSHQVFGLTGKNNGAIGIIAVIQRSDTDGVPGRDVGAGPGIIQNAGKLRIQHGKHIRSILLIQRQKHLAVRLTDKGILPFQLPAELLKPIDFPVAHHHISVQDKRLHSFRVQAHDGQTVKTKKALTCRNNTGIIRTSGKGTGEAFLEGFQIGDSAAIAYDGTHGAFLLHPAEIPTGGPGLFSFLCPKQQKAENTLAAAASHLHGGEASGRSGESICVPTRPGIPGHGTSGGYIPPWNPRLDTLRSRYYTKSQKAKQEVFIQK